MNVKDRVFICRMIEKIEHNKNYADKLGISNASTYNGNSVKTDACLRPERGPKC